MMDLLPAFQRALDDMHLLALGDSIVLGVSGGADSLAMLHLFVRSREALDLRLHVVHVDHRIRGEEAEADARFVAETCAAWDVPCRVERVDVPALAVEQKLSLEEAARQARYTVLGRAAADFGAPAVAVAHNADDQAETVLMHLLRGSGLAGLRGMLPLTPLSAYHLLEPVSGVQIIRPLLGAPRADIDAYCAEHGLTPRVDRTNADNSYFRNRLRHEVIPLLETLNPNLRALLGRTASVIAADYALLEREVDAAWEAVLSGSDDLSVQFDLAGWRALPLALRRGTIRRAAFALRSSLRDVSYQHVENALRVGSAGETGAQATLPSGLTLRVGYATLTIAAEAHHPSEPDWPLLPPGSRIALAAPGALDLPGEGWRFSLRRYDGLRDGTAWQSLLTDPWRAALDASALAGGSLALRTRRPGDRFQPTGLNGTQKIGNFMINAKIPAAWRDHLPLLVAGDALVWVCGWRVDARFAVRGHTGEVWIASFEQL